MFIPLPVNFALKLLCASLYRLSGHFTVWPLHCLVSCSSPQSRNVKLVPVCLSTCTAVWHAHASVAASQFDCTFNPLCSFQASCPCENYSLPIAVADYYCRACVQPCLSFKSALQAEKRRRQQEAADKAKKSAEEAQRALEAYNANPDRGPMQLDNAAPGADPSGHHSDGNRQDAPSTAQELEDEASAAAAAKLRQQQRADLLRRAEEGHAVRGEPLGLDRRHNRYWHLAADPSIPGDASTGRILVESYVDGTWRLLYKADQLEELMASLERKGAREGPLYNALVRYQPKVEAGMPSHPIQIPPALDQQSQHQHFQLNKEHHRTLWSIPVQAAAHIQGRDPGISLSTCMTAAVKLSKLKADMLRVEAALPSEALRDTTWSRAAWQSTVHNAQEVAPLQHALAELEMAIHPVSMWTNHHPRHLTAIKRDWLPIGMQHQSLPNVKSGNCHSVLDFSCCNALFSHVEGA